MPLDLRVPTPEGQRSPLAPTFVAAAILALLLVGYTAFYRFGSRSAGTEAAPSEEEKAYLPNIVVGNAAMSAASNIAGGRVIYLDAKLTNKGLRLVRRVELQLEFHDVLNQVVLRETARPISPRLAPLKPGETRDFQVAFERLPTDWNQAPPSIQPSRVSF